MAFLRCTFRPQVINYLFIISAFLGKKLCPLSKKSYFCGDNTLISPIKGKNETLDLDINLFLVHYADEYFFTRFFDTLE